MLLPEGDNDLTRITGDTKVIAVDMANVNNVTGTWKNHLTTVDFIERRTGFDFLSRVGNDAETALEQTEYRP